MVLPRLRGRKLGAGAQCGQSGKQKAEGMVWVGGSISEPLEAGRSSWLVLRLWLGKTGGAAFLPLSECVPPPTMRAAALSHLLPVAGWLCRATGGCRWADDSAKLRKPCGCWLRLRCRCSAPGGGSRSHPGAAAAAAAVTPERSNPHATEGAGAGNA